MARVVPAHEGFGTGHLAAFQVDLGLEVQRQLVLLDGAAELADHRQAHRAVLVLVGRVQRVTRVVAFGDVHGDVGAAEERIRILPMVG